MKNASPAPTPNPRARRFAAQRPTCLWLAALFCLALAAFAPAARAQVPQQGQSASERVPESVQAAPVGEVVDDGEVLRIDSNLVSIPAVVSESTGRAVPDLALGDFELKVDGQPKPIGELNRADTPVVLAMLFDNSSSLSKAREFEKQAATRFFQRIVRPIDRASVYSISTVPLLVHPLTNSVPTLVRTVQGFAEPEGATALFDTIAEAARYLGPYEGRKVIVIVSDGNDTISESSFDQAVQRALKADCQIYVVGTGDIESSNLTDTIARRRLQVMTAQTGGALYVPRTVDDLDAAFEQISKDISQQYVLSYYPTDDPADGRFRTIALSVKTRPTLRVRAREGYYATAGRARVRPRRARGGREKDTARAGGKDAAQDGGRQAASIDPLYAQPSALLNAARGADEARNISVKTRASNGARSSARTGPQEHTETSEADDAKPAPSWTVEPQVVSATSGTDIPVKSESHASSAQTPVASNPRATLSVAPAASKVNAAPQVERAAETTHAPVKKDAPRAPVSGGVLNGRAKTLPKPYYPATAKSVGAKGAVEVEVEIDEDGKVVRAQAVSGHLLLQNPAVTAARQARFSPTLLSGQPVRIKGLIVYNFL